MIDKAQSSEGPRGVGGKGRQKHCRSLCSLVCSSLRCTRSAARDCVENLMVFRVAANVADFIFVMLRKDQTKWRQCKNIAHFTALVGLNERLTEYMKFLASSATDSFTEQILQLVLYSTISNVLYLLCHSHLNSRRLQYYLLTPTQIPYGLFDMMPGIIIGHTKRHLSLKRPKKEPKSRS